MDENTFKALKENGEEVEYDLIARISRLDDDREYILYTDGAEDKEGNTQVYASIYNPDGDNVLQEIETQEEWDFISNIIKAMQEQDIERKRRPGFLRRILSMKRNWHIIKEEYHGLQ